MERFFLGLVANPYFAACAGLSVGAGIIIIFLSKYGTRIFFPGGTSVESKFLARLEKKIDEVSAKADAWVEHPFLCRQWLQENFVTTKAFEDWKRGRDPLWKRINRHAHDRTGKVIITEE